MRYFCARSQQFVLVTGNPQHSAFAVDADNLHIVFQQKLDLEQLLVKLKHEFGCERITVQTGGTLNALFLREKLLDYVDIVVAPVLVGGKDTATLIDGESLHERDELHKLGAMKLIDCQVLEDSYLRLRYEMLK